MESGGEGVRPGETADAGGGAFEEAVVAAIRAIPVGEVMTYGEVAAEAGRPRAARAVGNILAISAEDMPWWRVVGAGLHLVSSSVGEQRRLLIDEGWLVSGTRLRPRD